MKRMRNPVILVAAIAPLLCLACAPASQRVSLFDGQSLAGWTVLQCEATVDGGDIFIQGGNGLIQSEKQYADFILELEWLALADDNWDSGIYFRYDEVPHNAPWPARYQVNLRKGREGNVDGLPGATSEGLVRDGDWNHLKLTVQGARASLELNGQPAWTGDGLAGPASGYIALQAEVPGGGQYRFRNIYITELKSGE